MAYIQNPRRIRANRVRRSRGLGDLFSDALDAITGGSSTPDLTSIPVPTETTTTSTTSTSDPTPTAPPAATSNWVTVNGICKPTNPVFLSQLKDLQRQLNRVLDKLGAPLIAVDESVGSLTMTALGTIIQSTSAGAYGLSGIDLSCSAVCAQVATLTARASNLADFLGASSSVSSPTPAETPSYVGSGGQVVPQGPIDSATDMWNNMGTMGKLGIAGLAIGAVVFASGAKGMKRKPSKLRRSYRAARRHRRSRR